MKRNLIKGMILISAIALSSCSVNKTASSSKNDDDVYFSHATAAEEPVYITRNDEYDQDGGNDQYDDEDNYFYYDDYASRINRFGYYSPFGYYDNFYSPYGYGGWNMGLGFGYGGYGYGGLGWNIGLGYGYGGYGWGSPWGYGFGYSPWGYGGYYSPYSFWGIGYGYGYGGGYWGGYSAYRNNPRPYRGNGSPGSTAFGNRPRTAYGNNNGIGYIPNRGSRPTNGRPAYGDTRATRGVRTDRPTYQPRVERSMPSPSPSNSGGSRGGGGSSGGGGGGGRPVRN